MTSLAMRHKARMMARQNAAASASPEAKAGLARRAPLVPQGGQNSRAVSEYDLRRAELGEDLRALSEIQSIEKKIERKAELLPKYDDWCVGVLEAAAAAKDEGKRIETDDVLVRTMIWAIDCADADRALPRAAVVIGHGMELPSRFERTAGCMIAEEFAETAMKVLKLDESSAPALAPLQTIAELTAEEDMPDQVRAKLERAIGEVILRAADLAVAADAGDQGPAGGIRAAVATALGRFKRALQLDSNAGVKKMIEQRERQLRDLGAEPPE